MSCRKYICLCGCVCVYVFVYGFGLSYDVKTNPKYEPVLPIAWNDYYFLNLLKSLLVFDNFSKLIYLL